MCEIWFLFWKPAFSGITERYNCALVSGEDLEVLLEEQEHRDAELLPEDLVHGTVCS